MLIVLRKLNLMLRFDLAFKSTLFDTLWVEITCPKIKKNYLINISYNPKKLLYEEFLEQTARSIDRAITENKTIIMMGTIISIIWKTKKSRVYKQSFNRMI